MSINPYNLEFKAFKSLKGQPIIVVGDIHGRKSIVEQVLQQFSTTHHIVFIGDILDSYHVDPYECMGLLQLLCDLANLNKITLIPGNHELSYLYESMRCSGYSGSTAIYFNINTPLGREFLRVSTPLVWFNDASLLITHAGCNEKLWTKAGGEDTPKRDKAWKLIEMYCTDTGNPTNPIYGIGAYRGGRAELGGIFWLDWNFEFLPIPGLNQVMGHTQGQRIRTKSTTDSINWNVDCLGSNPAVLELKMQKNELISAIHTLN